MQISRRLFLRKALLGSLTATCMPYLLFADTHNQAVIDKLLPAPINGGYRHPDYWIWGSSVIKGKDGKYHMFADRWLKSLGFQAWVTN